jgi:Phage gp6-like head-tail connector protein
MPVGYTVLTPVQAEPVSLSDAKRWLRVDFDDDDELIAELIIDARRYAENILRRSLATQTIQAVVEPESVPTGSLSGPVGVPMDSWRLAERPDVPLFGNALITLMLPMGPLQSLTTLEYQLTRMDNPEWTALGPTDAQGNNNYRIDQINDPNRINLFVIVAATRYRLTYIAGYQSIPFDIRRNMLSLIGWWYLNREGQCVPTEIDMKFASKRVISFS